MSMDKAAKIGGAVLFIAAVLSGYIFYFARKGQTSIQPIGTSGAGSTGSQPSTTTDGTNSQPAGTGANQTSVNNLPLPSGLSNSTGSQTLQIFVHHIDNSTGALLNDETRIPYDPNGSYDFEVDGSLYQTFSSDSLAGWGVSVILIDPMGNVTNLLNLTTDSYGNFDNYFSIQSPKYSGEYIVRVAAGDASQDFAIEFVQSAANTTLAHTTGASQ